MRQASWRAPSPLRPYSRRVFGLWKNPAGVSQVALTGTWEVQPQKIGEFGADRPMEKLGDGSQEGRAWLPKKKAPGAGGAPGAPARAGPRERRARPHGAAPRDATPRVTTASAAGIDEAVA